MRANLHEWHTPPPDIPVFRRVEHVCCILVRTVESVVRPGRFTGKLKPKDVQEFRSVRMTRNK